MVSLLFEIIKYSEIKYPWKYTIPTNCFHLIYDNNIVYFVNDPENSHDIFTPNLLNYVKSKGYYEITINENNLLFPIPLS